MSLAQKYDQADIAWFNRRVTSAPTFQENIHSGWRDMYGDLKRDFDALWNANKLMQEQIDNLAESAAAWREDAHEQRLSADRARSMAAYWHNAKPVEQLTGKTRTEGLPGTGLVYGALISAPVWVGIVLVVMICMGKC